MGKPSKEDIILDLFFNYSGPWHFEEIVKKTCISRSNVTKWLQRLIKEGIIKKIKPKNKMPYFIAYTGNPSFKNRKNIYGLQKLHQSGLLNYLASIPAETVILFGSFSRWDWHAKSDIDIFIYGKSTINLQKFESELKREIQVFSGHTRKDFQKIGESLMNNIIQGHVIKGNYDFLKVQWQDPKILKKQLLNALNNINI